MSGENINGEELAIIINRGFQTLTDTMHQRFEGVETRLGNVETRLDRVETRLDGVETRLGDVENEVKILGQKIVQIDLRTQNQIDAQYERTSNVEKRTTKIETHLGLSSTPAKA